MRKIFTWSPSLPVLYGMLAGMLTLAMMFSFRPINPKNAVANANQYQGVYIFTDCTPANEYEVLGSIKPKGRGAMALGLKETQYTDIRDGLIKACKKDYPEADGIIIHLQSGGSDASDAIKFK